MRQETLTVVAQVQPQEEEALREALEKVPASVFDDPALGVHFARMFVIKSAPADGLKGWLVLESNFDAPEPDPATARTEHLELLAKRLNATLAPLFKPCGFTGNTAALADFLSRNQVEATAAYQGHANRELARIQLEKHLREVVLEFFETAPAISQEELFKRVRAHVRGSTSTDPRLAGLDIDAPAPPLPDALVRREKLHQRTLPWFENSGVFLPILRFGHLIYDWQNKDRAYDLRERQEAWTPADRKLFVDIAKTEDHGLQNALTHVVPLRPGTSRVSVLRIAHAYIDRLSKKYFIDVGDLGGIPSIHFAKWLLIDEGKRLLFLSNYDGSWESYLGDFVDDAALGLNLAWSCTHEYPKTRYLALDGASDEETFKAWGRSCQLPTQVFYSAYRDLSIAGINNNSLIRDRLHSPNDVQDLDTWFRRVT
jgi:hypothetical protein